MNVALSVCLLMVCCSYFCAAAPNVTVQTTFGKVKGLWNGKQKVRVFKGIPYAGSVSGDRRWTDPEFPPNWNTNGDEPLDATKEPPSCPQTCDYDKSPFLCPDPKKNAQKEDCLILNVYTPEDADENSNLPVFVFIHGGAYIVGYSSSPLYDGSYLASHFNIIVVTMNYRLGALGFLVFKDKWGGDIRGNFGIKDQRLALQWVQNEILNFGGDPGKVTLAGESAGAMSVAVHMTVASKVSEGLFHKAIIESDPFGIEYKTVEKEREHGHHFALWNFGLFQGCLTLECLRDKTAEQVVKAQSPLNYLPNHFSGDPWSEFLAWMPNVDPNGDELTGQPVDLFGQGKFTKVPTLLGTMTDEGTLFIYKAFKKPVRSPLYLATLAVMFGVHHFSEALKLYPADIFGDNRPQISTAFGDYGFTCSTLYSAKHAANAVPVYSYVFNYHLKLGSPTNPCYKLNCDGGELPFVWHTLEEVYTTEDRKFADIVSAYWGNFINNGDPNKPSGIEASNQNLPSWPLFEIDAASKGVSLVMTPDNMKTDDGYRFDFCEVLDNFGYGNTDIFEAIAGLVGVGTSNGPAAAFKDEL